MPLGAPGRVWSNVPLLCSLIVLFQGGPQPRGLFYSHGTRSLFCPLVAFFVSELLFLQRLVSKGLKMRASKQPTNHTNLQQKQHQNAHTVQTCKKTPSGRGQTSKIDDSYTVLAVFPKAQGVQKGAKMGAKTEPLGPPN